MTDEIKRPKKRKAPPPYTGFADAEQILEGIMHRQYWQSKVRDEIAERLREIVQREVAKEFYNRADGR